jgi:hypothetical protein
MYARRTSMCVEHAREARLASGCPPNRDGPVYETVLPITSPEGTDERPIPVTWTLIHLISSHQNLDRNENQRI